MSLRRIAETIADALPGDIARDVRDNSRVVVQSALEKMDLVSREELDIQEKVLQRTRQKVEALEIRVAELEEASFDDHATDLLIHGGILASHLTSSCIHLLSRDSLRLFLSVII